MSEKLFRNGRFEFIGNLMFGKEPKSTKRLSDTSKWFRTRLSLGVKNEGNSPFLTLEYIHEENPTTAKILGKDEDMFEVGWNETTDERNIELASDFIKTTVDLEDDFEKKKEYTALIFKKRNHEIKPNEEKTEEDIQKIEEYNKQIKELATNRIEFIHTKDVIDFLNTALPILKDKKVKITGNVKSNYFNGKNRLQYIPTFIQIVPDETPNKLEAYFDFFYEKDGIEDDTKAKRMYVNGYIGDKKNKEETLFPITVVLDYNKINTEDEQQSLLLDFLKSTFEIKDKKSVHKIGLQTTIISGTEEVKFDESCLSEKQLMSVKLGFKTLDDFKPKGKIFGDRIDEIRVYSPDLRNYPDGSEIAFSVADLGDYLVSDDSDVKLEDLKKDDNKEETNEEPEQSKEELMRQLFGR